MIVREIVGIKIISVFFFPARFEEESVVFATSYQKLVYFGHALEMLLHQVLEDEAEHSVGTARCNLFLILS